MQGIKLKAVGDIDFGKIVEPFEFVNDKIGDKDVLIGKRRLKVNIMERQGKLIGLLCFTLGDDIDSHNRKAVIDDINNLKKSVDYIVASVHWGIEGEWYPIPWQRELAFKMIDYGANLILGYGPGVVQGIEEYGNGLIVYSLGRFVGLSVEKEVNIDAPYGDKITKFRDHSFVLDCEFWGDRIVWDILPVVVQKDGRPKFAQNVEFKRFVKDDLSHGFGMANYGFYFEQFRVKK